MVAVVTAVMLIILLVVSGGLSIYQAVTGIKPSSDTNRSGIDYSDIRVPKPKITEDFLTVNNNSRPAVKIDKIKGIVVHYTANPGTDAKANRNYFESRKNQPDESGNKVSSHFIIGLDGTILQCIPLEEIAYASNQRNHDTISIECCHPDRSGKFSGATREALVHLTGWLCAEYNLDQEDMIRHYDVTGKLCPRYYVKHPKAWSQLKEDILSYIKSNRMEDEGKK